MRNDHHSVTMPAISEQQQLAGNIAKIRQCITACEEKYTRQPASTRLLAVSKTFPATHIEYAYHAGQRAFGENYVDEAIGKITRLGHLDIEWHYIGPIQSNKTRKIATHFSWVQSIASEKHAQRLNDQRPITAPPLNCCIQVNISHEACKSGVTPENVLSLAGVIGNLPRLRLRGIMAIPAKEDELSRQRQAFRTLSAIYQQLITEGHPLDTLSMGMTGDMEAAIAEGATMVRIGTAIFGTRQKKFVADK